jgi:hypothetical protein
LRHRDGKAERNVYRNQQTLITCREAPLAHNRTVLRKRPRGVGLMR